MRSRIIRTCRSTFLRRRLPTSAALLMVMGLQTTPRPGSVTAELGDVLQRPLPIREGIGDAHEPVTTSSSRAQAYYDQGLAHLHLYTWVEAARSFNEALRADPDLAMAHLGLSYALTALNEAGAARQAASVARSLSAKITEREKFRIELRIKQLDAAAAPDDAIRLEAYVSQLAQMLGRFPDDIEMLLIAGRARAPSQDSHGMHARNESLQYYERALKLRPDYFATHHYLTHAYENTGQLQRALEHGSVLVRLAPAVPHAHHMYAHVLRRAGRMTDAIAEFRKADDLEASFLRVERIPVEYDWHFQHNLELLGTSYQYVGKMAEAEAALRRAFAVDSVRSVADELNKKVWPMFLLAGGRTSEALAAAKAMTAHRVPLVQALGHLLVSRALMATGQTRQSAADGNEALRIMRSMGPLGGVLLPEFELTQGEYLVRTGELPKGRSMLRNAIAKLDSQSNPDSSLQTLYAVEAVARFSRELDDWQLAGDMAARMRALDPDYPGTMYALGRVAEHGGDRPAASAAYARAIRLWRDAEPTLGDLVDARERVERLPR